MPIEPEDWKILKVTDADIIELSSGPQNTLHTRTLSPDTANNNGPLMVHINQNTTGPVVELIDLGLIKQNTTRPTVAMIDLGLIKQTGTRPIVALTYLGLINQTTTRSTVALSDVSHVKQPQMGQLWHTILKIGP